MYLIKEWDNLSLQRRDSGYYKDFVRSDIFSQIVWSVNLKMTYEMSYGYLAGTIAKSRYFGEGNFNELRLKHPSKISKGVDTLKTIFKKSWSHGKYLFEISPYI